MMKAVNERGITLIALIITIIVMLILVAVSITLLTNSGIFGQASEAVLEMRAAQADEQASLWRVGRELGWEERNRIDMITYMREAGLLTTEEAERFYDDEYEHVERIGSWRDIHFHIAGQGPQGTPGNPILPPGPENTTNVQFSNATGVVEIVWIDLNNNVIENPLTPATNETWLAGMRPFTHNGTAWALTTASDANWYDYDNQRWANARDRQNSMFVWIPRYAYRIAYFNNAANANARRANPAHMEGLLGFSTRHGMIEVAGRERNLVEGTVPINVVGYVQTSEYSDYIPHPAFTFDTQIAGIWAGKFMTGYERPANTQSPQNSVLPTWVRVQSGRNFWRNISVASAFSTARGFANPNTNGITGRSIMMRNRDWGAVAYLSHSKFGRNGAAVGINNVNFVGGAAGGTTGAGGNNASTTGNVTGVFDMRGGVWEYVASYVNTAGAQTSTQIASMRNAAARYRDVYAVGGYTANRNIVGNAVFETSTTGNSASNSWFGASGFFPGGTQIVFVRGGMFDHGTRAGIFAFESWTRC